MSSARKLVINCGASQMSAAIFSNKAGKLLLESFSSRDLEYDYSSEDGWLPAVNAALREISREVKLSGPATLIIPGYQLLTKPIKIPHVDVTKQAQIIAFEAQQNIPYPLHEVAWGSQVVDDDGVESEVILIAMKLDAANRFCGAVTIPGLMPQALQASSLMDYNAFRLANPEGGEHTLLVNVGGRSTNLTFVGESGVFLRNIGFGGNNLTQLLADGLGTTFAQAERVKVGFFSGQTSFAPDDPAGAPLQAGAQSWMRRLSQEITKSVMAYRRQNASHKAPERILLTGRSSLLPGLSQFLCEAHKVAVDYFNPVSGVEVSPRVNAELVEACAYQMTEIVGEGARDVLKTPLGINLLPAPRAQALAFAKKKPLLVAAAVLLALAPAPAWLHFQSETSAYKEAAQTLNAAAVPLRDLQGQIQLGLETLKTGQNDLSRMHGLIASRTNWIELFGEFQQRLGEVKDVWLEDLTIVREPTLGPVDPKNSAAPRAVVGEPTYRLEISGRMLLRDFANADGMTERAQARVKSLLDGIKQSPFVAKIEGERYQFSDDRRILSFNFNLLVNPKKPL